MADATVKAIFAGDSSQLEKTMKNVGSGAKTMASDFEASSSKTKAGFDDVAEGIDGSERKFRGFGDTISGTNDIMGSFKDGNLVGVAMGFADLAGGITDFVVPAIKSVAARFGLMTGATAAQATATEGAAVAQTGLNTALLANPIGLVVAGLVALAAAFVIAWKNSETFRDIVKGTWDVVKKGAEATVGFFLGIGDKLWNIAGTVKDAILWPYKTAFNAIAKLWNNTVGQLAFEVPSWVPGIGGKGFSMPKLPEFHTGGVVPGTPGTEVPIMAMAGETVIPAGGAAGATTIQLVLDGRVLTEVVYDGLVARKRRQPLAFVT